VKDKLAVCGDRAPPRTSSSYFNSYVERHPEQKPSRSQRERALQREGPDWKPLLLGCSTQLVPGADCPRRVLALLNRKRNLRSGPSISDASRSASNRPHVRMTFHANRKGQAGGRRRWGASSGRHLVVVWWSSDGRRVVARDHRTTTSRQPGDAPTRTSRSSLNFCEERHPEPKRSRSGRERALQGEGPDWKPLSLGSSTQLVQEALLRGRHLVVVW
jgi:hypothetical protein